jgi:hypothetical protein
MKGDAEWESVTRKVTGGQWWIAGQSGSNRVYSQQAWHKVLYSLRDQVCMCLVGSGTCDRVSSLVCSCRIAALYTKLSLPRGSLGCDSRAWHGAARLHITGATAQRPQGTHQPNLAAAQRITRSVLLPCCPVGMELEYKAMKVVCLVATVADDPHCPVACQVCVYV